MFEIKVLKLVNGDEIIGAVKTLTNTDPSALFPQETTIKNAMRIVQEYNPKTRLHGMYIIDWMPALLGEILTIQNDKIITTGVPKNTIKDHYLELVLDDIDNAGLTASEVVNLKNLKLLNSLNHNDVDFN